jgi:hypothetical protein
MARSGLGQRETQLNRRALQHERQAIAAPHVEALDGQRGERDAKETAFLSLARHAMD